MSIRNTVLFPYHYAKLTYARLTAKKAFSECEKYQKLLGNQKIRVGFIIQYIQSWSKVKPIYELMKKDSSFEPVIICVPFEIKNHKLTVNDGSNGVYDYFIENKYKAINARKNGGWLNLKKLRLNYVFYSRPYNKVMPKEYISDNVAKYTRICGLLYGLHITKDIMPTVMNNDFDKNIFINFASVKEEADYFRNAYIGNCRKGIQHSCFYGIPALQCMFEKGESNNLWEFARNGLKVLWTPRWTSDMSLGGTSFFELKDFIFDYAQNNRNINFLIRPHPLMFDHFVETGEMTAKEAEEYRAKIDSHENTSLDTKKEYISTFWESDAIVADVSGIIPDYFVTGKPIIYYEKNPDFDYTELARDIFSVCYIAHNANDVKKYLDMLASGNDPLKEKRKQKVKEVYEGLYKTSAQNICKKLKELAVK